MSNKLKPNFTQIPNYFLDEIYKDLTVYEITALIFLCRKIYGWHKIGDKDKISYSQFMKNTPLKRNSLVKALEGLEKKEIILTFKQHRKTTEYTLNLDRVCEINSTSLSDKPKKVKSSLPDKHTKESNINKLVKENIDATHLEKQNNNFSIHKEIQKIYEKGFFDLTKEKIDFTGKNGKIIGSHIKSLIVKGENKYRSIYIKSKKQRLAYLEIRRRSAILFKRIQGGDEYFGGFEFLPWVLVKFWNKFAIEKTKVSKKELQENSLSDSVASVTKFLKNK